MSLVEKLKGLIGSTRTELDTIRHRIVELTLRANDDETKAPRKFSLEGVGEPSRGHAQ